jgi:hypothetical protein
MKTLLAALALATLIAAPALTPSASAASPNDVVVGGRVVGSDPDPNIRFQLLRDNAYQGY